MNRNILAFAVKDNDQQLDENLAVENLLKKVLTTQFEKLNNQDRLAHILVPNFEKARKNHPRNYERWSKDEEDELLKEFKNSLSINQIAVNHKRTMKAIAYRLLDLIFRQRNI